MPTEDLSWLPVIPASLYQGAATIGNFDGVHRGHQTLVAELRRLADALQRPAVVVTFDLHPLQILQPHRCLPMLTTSADRDALLQAAGADHVLIIPATRLLLNQSARVFFEQMIRERLNLRAMVEGPDFRFGHKREGNVNLLKRWCHESGIQFEVVPPMSLDGAAVSSSRVREALGSGQVEEAARLLGRFYRLHGVVGTGQRRGTGLGFPTANLEQIATLIPGDGVYAVRVHGTMGAWPGAANLGPNPTFGEQARKVEIHLIGFQGEIGGQTLAVDFLKRLRETRPFAGVAELVAQLHKDVEQARQIVASMP